jgi:hypothetical protein
LKGAVNQMQEFSGGFSTARVAILLGVSETTVQRYADVLDQMSAHGVARVGGRRVFSVGNVAVFAVAQLRLSGRKSASFEDAVRTVLNGDGPDSVFLEQLVSILAMTIWVDSRVSGWQREVAEFSASSDLHIGQIDLRVIDISERMDDLSRAMKRWENEFNRFFETFGGRMNYISSLTEKARTEASHDLMVTRRWFWGVVVLTTVVLISTGVFAWQLNARAQRLETRFEQVVKLLDFQKGGQKSLQPGRTSR